MIRLDCPQCQRSLEIDDGFAGGVCRCFDCGTLMTVPVAGEHAERLTRGGPASSRPDRPDTPAPGSSRTAAPEPASAAPVAEQDQPEVFVTSTGRTVRLTHEQVSHVAVARKPRMGLRIGIIAGFVVIVLAMAIGIAVLAINTFKAQEQEKLDKKEQVEKELSRDLSQDILAYNPDANPLLLTTPNLLGMPVPPGPHTLALVIDSSSAMRDYINFIAVAIEANLKTLPADVAVQVIFADEAGVHAMPDAPAPFAQWDQAALKQLLDGLNPVGIQKLPAGLEKALAGKPDRVVMVTALAPVKPVMDQMSAALDAAATVQCDVFQLGRSNDALQQLAESHKGTYLNLPGGQINNWYHEYQRK